MIIQFQKHDLTFFPEDQDYFEKRIQEMSRSLGSKVGDEDTTKVDIKLTKDRHHSGERFHARAHVVTAEKGDFFAEADAENIKALADKLKDDLDGQARKFHEKRQR